MAVANVSQWPDFLCVRNSSTGFDVQRAESTD